MAFISSATGRIKGKRTLDILYVPCTLHLLPRSAFFTDENSSLDFGQQHLQYYLLVSFGCYHQKPKINNGSMNTGVVSLFSFCLVVRVKIINLWKCSWRVSLEENDKIFHDNNLKDEEMFKVQMKHSRRVL